MCQMELRDSLAKICTGRVVISDLRKILVEWSRGEAPDVRYVLHLRKCGL